MFLRNLPRTLSVLASALITGCASVADAGSLLDVTVTNRTTNETLPVYRHQGRLYVEGKAGERYVVHLRNRSGGRLLTVLSVDGVNAITGQTAAASQSGYVLTPYAATEISGWRKSDAEVAAFYFTALPDSYAARTGRPDNIGVIGVAAYREMVPPPAAMLEQPALAKDARRERDDVSRRLGAMGSASPSPAAAPEKRAEAFGGGKMKAEANADTLASRLGTGHGERLHEPTSHTEFRRATTRPAEVVTIYYDSRANLIAQGVLPRPVRPARLPQAFPNHCYVPDPV